MPDEPRSALRVGQQARVGSVNGDTLAVKIRPLKIDYSDAIHFAYRARVPRWARSTLHLDPGLVPPLTSWRSLAQGRCPFRDLHDTRL